MVEADLEEIRQLRRENEALAHLSVDDQVADAVVAIYCARVVTALTLERMADIADLDRAVVKRAWLRRVDRQNEPLAAKRCRKCGARRSIGAFDKLRSSPDGYAAWCRPCLDEFIEERRMARTAAG